MLVKFDVTNRRGQVFTFVMEENDSGYQVADIDGLEPVKATLVSSSFAGSDGEEYQTAKRGSRNIKIKFDLQPDFNPETFSTLRRNLYTYFMPKSRINLRFYLDTGLYVDISGYVEEFSSPRFELDPQVDISIMCFQPDFIDPRTITINGYSVADSTNTPIDYPGTVETGFTLTLDINRSVPSFSIYNEDDANNLSQFDFFGPLADGDQLVISTVRGSKGIILMRGGVSSSYLYGKSAQSAWIELFEGVNNFRVYATGAPLAYELEYSVRYGGL